MRHLLLSLSILLFFYACEDETETQAILIVKPDDFVQTAKAGEKILYTLTASSKKTPIQHITISTYSPEQGLQTVFDTIINQQVAQINYQYTVPPVNDTTNIKLYFESSQPPYPSIKISRIVKVAGGEIKLDELAGITLYSTSSGRPDAFQISNGQLINSHTTHSDSIQDIFAWQDSTADAAILSREWRSPSGLKFARANSFDYASATQLNIDNTYRSCIKQNYVRDLKPDDIILIGNDDKALGVIKIIYIFDDPGTINDRYLFNIKRTRTTTTPA